ncbi:MAG: hypothetical protein ACHQNT_11055 [Bacteroidia bacterium]
MKKILLAFGFFLVLAVGKSNAQNQTVSRNESNPAVAPSISATATDAAAASPAVTAESPKDKSANSESKKSCCKKGSQAGKSCCSSKNEAKIGCGHNHSDKAESKKEIKESGATVN